MKIFGFELFKSDRPPKHTEDESTLQWKKTRRCIQISNTCHKIYIDCMVRAISEQGPEIYARVMNRTAQLLDASEYNILETELAELAKPSNTTHENS